LLAREIDSIEQNAVSHMSHEIKESDWKALRQLHAIALERFSVRILDELHRITSAKEKKLTMDTYWVPGVNNLKTYGRWSFAEFTEMYGIEVDFKTKVEAEFNKMIAGAAG
jgi:hypothetical protein